MNLLLLITAFGLSSVAAYYSIAGLVAIFAAAPIPIIVMGSVLEVSKLVVASWLYRNWRQTKFLLRSYFVAAIIVLMFLTSMGTFGYLSKAHVDQNLSSGNVTTQLAIIDEKIKTEKENIDANRKVIAQLDEQVNQTLARSTTEAGASRSAGLRSRQAKERKAAQEEILSSQAKVAKLNEERAPIAAQVREVEAEVGPIKYIAQLIYGQEATDQNTLEQAVRWVIILIVLVFDPLAVLMFIAYNQSVYHKKIIKPSNDSHMIHETEKEQTAPSAIQKEIVSQDLQNEQIVNNEKQKASWTKIKSTMKKKQVSKEIAAEDAATVTDDIQIKNDNVEWERDRKLERTE